jgi:1-deoxy-D-xylulose-5-phosphate synthase
VILNDNAIGIDPSIGALKDYLTAVKEGKNPKQNNIIKSLNFDYSGPIDGHDLPKLISELERLKSVKGPKFLHVITTKGKGLQLAEEDQVKYHAPGKFDAETGKIHPKDESHLPPKFQDVFGHTLVELAKQNEKIIGITPAMPTGSSMTYMMEAFPKRAIDVGIAEQHAVTLAAGMATQGMVVFCNIYSTFLQRAYDQVIHDVALQNLPVIFCLDRAGLVGEDGATHHGVFDIAYLNCIPNLIIAAPKDEMELRNIMYTASEGLNHPIAIRYPRGRGENVNWEQPFEKMEIGKIKELQKGTNVAVLSTGTIGNNVTKALKEVENSELFSHYHFPFIKPLDLEVVKTIIHTHEHIITVEEGVITGGFGEQISTIVATTNLNKSIVNLGIPDSFIEHGTVFELQQLCKIDVKSIIQLLNTY